MSTKTLAQEIDRTIRNEFPGHANAGLRAKIRAAVAAPVDELWPTRRAQRVRGLARTVALTAMGASALDAVASAVEEWESIHGEYTAMGR